MLFWTSQIQNHPAIKKFDAGAGLGNPLYAPQLLALGHILIVGWGKQLVVFSTNLETGGYELRSPFLNFPIGSLVVNSKKTLLAICSQTESQISGTVVVPLDFLNNLDLKIDSSLDILVHQIKNSSHFSTVHMDWHPLSSEGTALAILDSASVFRLYEVSKSLTEPEIEFDLGGPETAYDVQRVETRLKIPGPFVGDETAINFSWASGSSWEPFSLFILYKSGAVSCLCPIIPKLNNINSLALEKLIFSSIREMSSLVPPNTLMETVSLKKELEAKEVLLEQSSLSVQYLSNIINSSNIQKRIVTANKSNSVPNRVNLPYLPVKTENSNLTAYSMAIISTPQAPILAVAYTNGTIVISAVTKKVTPLWATKNAPYKSGRLTILETLHLKPDDKCSFGLKLDPLRPTHLLVHGLNAYVINLTPHFLALNSKDPPINRLSASIQSLWNSEKVVTGIAFVSGLDQVKFGIILASKIGEIKAIPSRAAYEVSLDSLLPPKHISCLLNYSPSIDPTLLFSKDLTLESSDSDLSSKKISQYNPPSPLSETLDQIQVEAMHLNQTSDIFTTRLESQRQLINDIKDRLLGQSQSEGFPLPPLEKRITEAQQRYSNLTQKLKSMDQKLQLFCS